MSSAFEKKASSHMIQVGENRRNVLRCLYHEPKSETSKTLVLIPGFNSLPSAWDELLLQMYNDYRIYVIETREKHTSKLSKNAKFTAERFAEDIAEVIEYMMIEDYILVASSMGAAFVLRALSKKLIQPEYSFLVGPVLKVEIPGWSWPFTHVFYPFVYKIFLKPLGKMYIKHKFIEEEQIKKYFGYADSLDPNKVRKSLLQLKKFRITEEELKSIKQTCILIGAEKDKLHQSQTTYWIHEILENSQYRDLGTNIAAHGKPLVDLIQEIYE